jgi:hypothetical protein
MEPRETFLSLFDYLGKAAGPALGRKVAAAATKARLKLQTRAVANPSYAGFVYLYPKDFLDGFFAEPNPMDDATLGDLQDYYSLNK